MSEGKKEPWYSVTSKIVGLILGVIALAGMAVSAILFLSGLLSLPKAFSEQALEIRSIREEVTNLTVAFNSSKPNVLDIEGIGVVSGDPVKQGDSVILVYTLRRNITCETEIEIRFWDHDTNLIASDYSYRRATNKAPVTKGMIYFPVTVKIPDNLPPGTYSYAPIIRPLDCGVYTEQTVALSEKFEVIAK